MGHDRAPRRLLLCAERDDYEGEVNGLRAQARRAGNIRNHHEVCIEWASAQGQTTGAAVYRRGPAAFRKEKRSNYLTRHSFAPDGMRSPKPPLLTAAAALAPQVTLLTTKAKSPSFATWPMPGVPEDGAAGLPVVDFPVVKFPPGAATTMTIARMTNPRKPRELRTGCLRRSETAGPVLKGVGDRRASNVCDPRYS